MKHQSYKEILKGFYMSSKPHHNDGVFNPSSLTRILYKIKTILLIIRMTSYILILLIVTTIIRLVSPVRKTGQDINNEHCQKYIKQFYHRPAYCVFKALEGKLFRKIDILEPSLEIGVEYGEISKLHFCGKRISIGMEYVPQILLKAKQKGNLTHFNNLISADVNDMPFRSGTLKTVLLVHVLDHVMHIDKAISEVSRVLQPGGITCFSLLSNIFPSQFLISKLFEKVGINGNRHSEKNLQQKYSLYNFLSPFDWQEKLKRYDLELIDAKYFLSNRAGILWNMFYFNFELGRHSIYLEFPNIYRKNLFIHLTTILFSFFYEEDEKYCLTGGGGIYF